MSTSIQNFNLFSLSYIPAFKERLKIHWYYPPWQNCCWEFFLFSPKNSSSLITIEWIDLCIYSPSHIVGIPSDIYFSPLDWIIQIEYTALLTDFSSQKNHRMYLCELKGQDSINTWLLFRKLIRTMEWNLTADRRKTKKLVLFTFSWRFNFLIPNKL